ncbi:ATP-binding protein [Dactylosporangium sp. CS-047395]|uniref:ATP-binding protein n=1 Tax=Dactylosporangium sp. CS-047395 TaxID=3239936 RepID=UPI003D910AF3
MRITTLGALAVDGRPVRGERLAALIRALLDARGRTVSLGALTDAVWGGAEPPSDTAGAVQALAGRARRLGLVVAAAPGGYRIPLDAVEIDAVMVRELADRGRRALRDGDVDRAGALAAEARGLFPPRPELTEAGLVRLFGEVVTLQAEAALVGGRPAEEGDLHRLASLVPPDERAAALLVRVLAAQGRDAEALELVERVRGGLAERYGAGLSPALADAHLALLRGPVTPERAHGTGPHVVVRLPGERTFGGGRLPGAWQRPRTPLVGRDADLAAVGRALREAPLVTVVATGGAGKTRLAAEIARAESRSGRPVRVVELAGVRAPAEVLAALPAAGPELDGLLVLDNCEHVLDAAAAGVAALLDAAAPGFGVLATSRAALGLVGEVVHRLPMLDDDAAVALLTARAQAGGAVIEEGAEELCRRLDNLPLALELAAARLRHMPIGDVLAGLDDRFGLLDHALRGLPERHAGLWAMVDWSRELLAPAEQRLLERLAVIPGPFTAELAEAVGGQRKSLAVLVEQSLLRMEDGRYRMLETVREYGEARLDASGGRDAAMEALVAWAVPHAVGLAGAFIGPGQLGTLERTAAEQDTLVAALRWSLERGDEPAAADLALALFQLWTVRGRHAETTAWARRLLHLDDPGARRRSAILHGAASGRPLPHADRLAQVCVLIALNAGSTGPARLIALARQALRTLFAERPQDVSPRQTALAAALPGLEHADPDRSLADAANLVEHPDPYVQGMGHFIRAVLTEHAAGDAVLAYRRFEAAGDHWGMGMAAHAAGHATGGGQWLRRSEHHLQLLGAAQDARETRVLLDTQLALAGDEAAEQRLLGVDPEDEAAGQADLGLAELAWRRGRYDEAREFADRPKADPALRIAAAVIHLWAGGAEAAGELRRTRAEVLAAHDRPLLGTWAMGGAELAAFRGDAAAARELWALGTRAGANVSRFFPPGRGERLAAVLGDDRPTLLARAATMSGSAVYARIQSLMAALLP